MMLNLFVYAQKKKELKPICSQKLNTYKDKKKTKENQRYNKTK
jgi:hypothetical protein